MGLNSNFWMRKSDVTKEDIYGDDDYIKKPEEKVRQNAYVQIIPDNGPKLPFDKTKLDEVYTPDDSKRPMPVLGDVEISMKGLAGTLRRVRADFTCFSKDQFNKFEPGILVPGSKITVKWGYVSGGKKTDETSAKFVVFKPSFKITKENYFKCSFEGIGRASEYDILDINGQQGFPRKEFKTNYQGGEELTKTANLFDYLQYLVQKETSQLEGSKGFDPKNGASKGGLEGGGERSGIAVHTAPEKYEPLPGQAAGGWFSSDKIQYVSLALIVACINERVLSRGEKAYKIEFDDKYSAIKYNYTEGKIWSPSPFELLFPYSEGTVENSYNKDGTTGKSSDWVTCDSFVHKGFKIDGAGTHGHPGGILFSMDLLRTIQAEFDNAAKREKTSTEDIGSDRDDGRIQLLPFFKRLFGVIRENSGGSWDLVMEREDSKDDQKSNNIKEIFIVNRNCPIEKVPEVLTLDPISGKNGVREISIVSEIPKEMQARAMAGDVKEPQAETFKVGVQNSQDEGQADAAGPDQEPAPSLKENLKELRGRLTTDEMSQDAVSAARGAIRDLINAEPRAQALKDGEALDPKNVPFPLKFSATMDGVDGFRFGDLINSSYLPWRYRKTSGQRPVFTIIDYSHRISATDWTTEVNAIMRMVNS